MSQKSIIYIFSNTFETILHSYSKTVDGVTGANQTNIALKGILGVRAMSELALIQGDNAAATSYKARKLVVFYCRKKF